MIGLDGVTGAQGLRKAEAIPVVVATLHGSNQADFVFFYTKERERRGGEIRGREGGGRGGDGGGFQVTCLVLQGAD